MVETLFSQIRDRMRKALEVTQTDLSSIRSGRASPALVEHIVVSVYDNSQRLKLMELATVICADTRTLQIVPFDPAIVNEIARGILETNVGLTPVVDGDIIRITIPALSQEQRQEYIKLARTKLEGGRIMIRQIRQDAMHQLKRIQEAKEISEDQLKHGEKLIQELTDEMIAEVDALGERKEHELLQV